MYHCEPCDYQRLSAKHKFEPFFKVGSCQEKGKQLKFTKGKQLKFACLSTFAVYLFNYAAAMKSSQSPTENCLMGEVNITSGRSPTGACLRISGWR